MTPSLQVVSPNILRNSSVPPRIEMTKYFYKPHIEKLRKEFEEVKELGSATAGEWIKGLDEIGKDRLCDASRWEQWEAKGGLRKVNQKPPPKTKTSQAVAAVPSSLPPMVIAAVTESPSERSTPISFSNTTEGLGKTISPGPTIHHTVTPMPGRGYGKLIILLCLLGFFDWLTDACAPSCCAAS